MGSKHPVIAVLAALSCAAGFATSALGAGDGSPQELLAAARRAYERKRYREAQRLATQIVTRHPRSRLVVDARLVSIDARIEEGHLSRAYQACEELLAAHPGTPHRTRVLRRELRIGDALTREHVRVLFLRFSRLEEGVDVLERVIEHAPFGALADDAVFAIAEAHYRQGDYEAARDHYDRLLKHYARSELAARARKRRALCNCNLAERAPHDSGAAEAARRDIKLLPRSARDEGLTRRAEQIREMMARGEYETGIFYFRRENVEAGMRYLESVLVRYPDSEYATRARRILQEGIVAGFPDSKYAARARRILAKVRAAQAEGKP